MNNKTLLVKAGPAKNELSTSVELNGVMADERLTRKIAAQAARVAFGHRDCVTVLDMDAGYGYRLYANSARKIWLDK
jgi:hypothetical protein